MSIDRVLKDIETQVNLTRFYEKEKFVFTHFVEKYQFLGKVLMWTRGKDLQQFDMKVFIFVGLLSRTKKNSI